MQRQNTLPPTSSAGKGIEFVFLGVKDGLKGAEKLWEEDKQTEERSLCPHNHTVYCCAVVKTPCKCQSALLPRPLNGKNLRAQTHSTKICSHTSTRVP